MRALLDPISPLGWLVLGAGVAAVLCGLLGGWVEFSVIGLTCLLLFVLACPFLIGRTRLEVSLSVEPTRVLAGESVASGVLTRNVAIRPLLGTTMVVPVGGTRHRYRVGTLAAGAEHEESFTIRTERRGVIPVGPVSSRRGDPLGLAARDLVWTDRLEILVRPEMLPLDSLGAGLLRDLEGVSTDAVSQSDLAFHALREYVPGDDLRHVHWRSSAKAIGAGGEANLLVRQYLDTRRSHAVLSVDDRSDSWTSSTEYEVAMSVAASVTVRALLDEFDVTFVSGTRHNVGADPNLALDAICRATPGREGLLGTTRRAVRVAPSGSLALLITGSRAEFTDVLRASGLHQPEVRRLAVIVDPNVDSHVTETAGLRVLNLARLADLPGLLQASAR